MTADDEPSLLRRIAELERENARLAAMARQAGSGGDESQAAGLRELVDTLDLGAFMTRDFAGTIRHWSAGCERLYGWTAVQAVGRVAQDLLHTVYPVGRQTVEDMLHREGRWAGDLRHRTRDGREIVVYATKMLRVTVEGPVILESVSDVTAQRTAETALALSEARLRLATEAGEVGVFDLDLRTGALTWDDRMRALFGVPPGAPVSREAISAAIPEPHRGIMDRAVEDSLARTDRRDWSLEYPVLPLDGGEERIVAARWRVIHVEGTPVRIVGTAVDVTVHRRAEAVLARDKAELERIVATRTSELQQAQARLAHAQRMDALGQLAGGIAHDFNNVLHAIQGGAGLIERRAGDSDRVLSLAKMITEAAERGAAVTRRLLTFSRRGDLRAEPVDVAALFDSLREMLIPALGPGIEVQVAVEEGLPPLLADKGQLETMLVNLATNARDAMPGGGTLTLAARRGAPDGRLDGISIVARDTGAGMSPEVVARATEPFFTTKPRGKGTGLGLSMARGFAEQSGGGFEIDSVPGGGTTVTAWFPLALAPAQAVSSPDVDHVDARRRGCILLVDDDAMVRAVTAAQLDHAGFRVVQAERGAEALTILDGGTAVDLLVSDLSMPGMDGIAVIREARRRIAGLPAILLTGFATNAAEIATGEESHERFALLRKPTSARQLVDSVSSLLRS